MKFCKDCKYADGYYDDWGIINVFTDYSGYTCLHEKAIINTDMITGTISRRDCIEMRILTKFCGEVAKLFEPSLWYRIKNGLTRCFRKSQKNNGRLAD